MRALITEICAQKSWGVIEKAQIKGLNYRFDGVKDNGFYPVPAGPNVPLGLCVQGKDTKGATKVIAELEKLKTSSN